MGSVNNTSGLACSDFVPIATTSLPGSSVLLSEGAVKSWVLTRGQCPLCGPLPVLPGSLLNVCEGGSRIGEEGVKELGTPAHVFALL